jgi:hypothetical protein
VAPGERRPLGVGDHCVGGCPRSIGGVIVSGGMSPPASETAKVKCDDLTFNFNVLRSYTLEVVKWLVEHGEAEQVESS